VRYITIIYTSLHHVDHSSLYIINHKKYINHNFSIVYSGAGSILEAISKGKTLIVVVNPTLQGNHQSELAYALAQDNYCLSTIPQNFCEFLYDFQATTKEKGNISLKAFPTPDHDLFPNLVDSIFLWE